MQGIYLIAVMVIVGGVIAFVGDKIGTKIGKKRLSMFGLRPRHTSMIVTVITGSLITGLSIGTMAFVSKDVRTALFGMEELNAVMAATKRNLEDVTSELFVLNDEYKKSDVALAESKKEVSALKSEQEELTAESERLKEGNEQLAAEKDALTAQNENLAGANAELESNNSQLKEFNLTLTADNEKLSADKAELEEHTKNLREGLIAMREGDIAFRAGEVLSAGVLSGGRSLEETTDDINRLIETASRNIVERFGVDNEESAVWVYQPEMQEIIEKISSSSQDMVLRVTAAGNLVRGEPVRTKLNIFPNNKIYDKNGFVFSGKYEVNGGNSEKILREFLSGVNHAAVEKGILPDPITGTIGSMNADQLYEIADAIDATHGKIQLTAYAKESTSSIGPLRLTVKLSRAE